MIERVTFHSEETGFAVLRVKVTGHRELVTLVGTLANVNEGEWMTAQGYWIRIMARQGQGAWHGVRWDGKTAFSFPLDERDETKAMQALLLQHPLEEAARPSDREIDTNMRCKLSH
jgi:hypothetical protein